MQILSPTRQVNQNVPIVMLTARDSEKWPSWVGLEIGADDYVAKTIHAVNYCWLVLKHYYVVHNGATVADNTFASEFDVETDHVKINNENTRSIYRWQNKSKLNTPKEFDLLLWNTNAKYSLVNTY